MFKQELPEMDEGWSQQGEQKGIDKRNDGKEFETIVPRPQARAFKGKFGLEKAKGGFNGIITNDKFCMTRWGRLELSWWRRPLRLREGSG